MKSTRDDILKKLEKSQAKLIAVSKKQSVEKIKNMYDLGQRVFGENYIQEFLEKKPQLPSDIEWHLIGPIQKNKINKILECRFELIHAVGNLETAQAISQRVTAQNPNQNILLQVNLADEDSKSGMSEKELMATAKEISVLTGITLCGLMTMPPLVGDPELSRPYFKKLNALKKELQKTIPTMRELSMGTTQDFPQAAEEGATLVRIGEALFGPRS